MMVGAALILRRRAICRIDHAGASEFTAAPALICIAAAAAADGWHDLPRADHQSAADGWHDHPREDQHQSADHQSAADGWHDHPREDEHQSADHQSAADHQHWKHYHWYITWLLLTTTAINWWEDNQGTTQVSISVLEKGICWNFETLSQILTKCINWHMGLQRPGTMANAIPW